MVFDIKSSYYLNKRSRLWIKLLCRYSNIFDNRIGMGKLPDSCEADRYIYADYIYIDVTL